MVNAPSNIGFHYNASSALCCDGIDLSTIQSRSPFYIYSLRTIDRKYHQIAQELKDINCTIAYAIKANPNKMIINHLASIGSGADVVSGKEMERAIECGVSPKKIVFSGVGKQDHEIEYAIINDILQINVESIEELEVIHQIADRLGKTVRIALRVNPNVSDDDYTHSKITTGRRGNKFGIDITDIQDALNKLKQLSRLKFVGFACHIGSQITNVNIFAKAFGIIKELVRSTISSGFQIQTLDFGGGIGISYKDEQQINLSEYVNEIKNVLSSIPTNITAIIEPGRLIVAEAGVLVSKVIYIKRTRYKNFLIIDAGMNDLIRPALYGSYHSILPCRKNNGIVNKQEVYSVVGPVCETSDVFLDNYKMDAMQRGDRLAIMNVGAYGFCMASTYNLRELPEEIVVQ